jgi:Tol biopolymer transport system component
MISYPDGTRRRITNELNDYGEVSIAADSRTIAAWRTRRSKRLWALPLAGSGDPKQLTTGFANDDAVSQLAAMPGGGIVVQSPRDGRSALWVVELGGTRPRRVSPEHMGGWSPHVARSSGAIVFTGVRDDRVVHAWKVDRDGENLIQLTNGRGEWAVAVSPDGETVLFFRFDDPGLWKLSLRGGQPVQIGQRGSATCEYSSDGTRLLLTGAEKDATGRLHPSLYVNSADRGETIRKMIDAPGFAFHWAPSGDAATYIREVDGVANIWSQPLAGGAPRRITDFKSGQIWEHAFSTDGKQLFMLRGQQSSEVVLITNFR